MISAVMSVFLCRLDLSAFSTSVIPQRINTGNEEKEGTEESIRGGLNFDSHVFLYTCSIS